MWKYTHPIKPELFHHGIKDQKWGVRNGPPYPLDRQKNFTKKRVRDNIKANDIYKRMSGFKEIRLNPKEYGHIMHELVTNITREQMARKIVHKCIGDYRYTFENNNGIFRVIGKKKID